MCLPGFNLQMNLMHPRNLLLSWKHPSLWLCPRRGLPRWAVLPAPGTGRATRAPAAGEGAQVSYERGWDAAQKGWSSGRGKWEVRTNFKKIIQVAISAVGLHSEVLQVIFLLCRYLKKKPFF